MPTGSCIDRSCRGLDGLQILQVKATRVPGMKAIVYKIYIEQINTGRSWVVLRRYSEIHRMRSRLFRIAQMLFHYEDPVFVPDQAMELVHQMEALKFPSRLNFILNDKTLTRRRARGLGRYLQGLLDLVRSKVPLLSKRQFLLSRIGCMVNSIQSLIVSLLGGDGEKIQPQMRPVEYQFPEAIPQYLLKPEARVVVSKCRALSTVIERDEETRFDTSPAIL